MFVDGNIDGKLFLTLLEKPNLLAKLNLTIGGEAKIEETIQVSSFISYELFLLMRQCNVCVCRKSRMEPLSLTKLIVGNLWNRYDTNTCSNISIEYFRICPLNDKCPTHKKISIHTIHNYGQIVLMG